MRRVGYPPVGLLGMLFIGRLGRAGLVVWRGRGRCGGLGSQVRARIGGRRSVFRGSCIPNIQVWSIWVHLGWVVD